MAGRACLYSHYLLEHSGYGVMTAQLDAVFGALADPTRRAILARLAQGDLTVGELAAPFTMSQPAISRHLRVLEDAGLISRSRRATARLSHLEAEPMKDASDWLARYRRFWEERYEQLDDLLETLRRSTPMDGASEPDTASRKDG